jgi:hypothetical protein
MGLEPILITEPIEGEGAHTQLMRAISLLQVHKQVPILLVNETPPREVVLTREAEPKVPDVVRTPDGILMKRQPSASTSKSTLALMALAAGLGGFDHLGLPQRPKAWKPEFTEEELEYVRSLPRKERKKAVEALKAKKTRAHAQAKANDVP